MVHTKLGHWTNHKSTLVLLEVVMALQVAPGVGCQYLLPHYHTPRSSLKEDARCRKGSEGKDHVQEESGSLESATFLVLKQLY